MVKLEKLNVDYNWSHTTSLGVSLLRSPLNEEAITEEVETPLYGVDRTADVLWDRLYDWNIKINCYYPFHSKKWEKERKIKDKHGWNVKVSCLWDNICLN